MISHTTTSASPDRLSLVRVPEAKFRQVLSETWPSFVRSLAPATKPSPFLVVHDAFYGRSPRSSRQWSRTFHLNLAFWRATRFAYVWCGLFLCLLNGAMDQLDLVYKASCNTILTKIRPPPQHDPNHNTTTTAIVTPRMEPSSSLMKAVFLRTDPQQGTETTRAPAHTSPDRRPDEQSRKRGPWSILLGCFRCGRGIGASDFTKLRTNPGVGGDDDE